MARVLALALTVLLAASACSVGGPSATTEDQRPTIVAPGTTSPSASTSATPQGSTGTEPTPGASSSTVPPPATETLPPQPPATTVPIEELTLRLDLVARGFAQPVLALSPPGDERLFVVDQPGRIWVLDGEETYEFLDIRSSVRFNGEQGLLGLAFHPDYGSNGLFYVYFTNNRGTSVVAEFAADPDDRNRARPGSRREVMLVSQPAANHNGGMIGFGPDGLLWIGLGDGGGGNDRYRNGQRSDRRLASLLRIEVGPGAPEPFGDPVDGPFVADGGLPEVWSIGLRNPWRWAFDGDLLYIADVGQNRVEEIDVVPAAAGGLNFGWPIMEGGRCFQSSGCDQSGLVQPVYTYRHSDGCSITGGFVYRGSDIPELDGHYLFGDYCSGWVDSIVVVDGAVVSHHRWFDAGTVTGLTSFGIDSKGELYVTTTGGRVYRITRAEA